VTQPTADRLALLYRVSQVFNSSLDLDAVLTRVMDEVIAATRAERGFLMLADAEGKLAFRAARGMEQQTIDAPEFQISRGLVERVAREGQPLLASDAQSDDWLSRRASVTGLRLRSILCVPLKFKDAILGVIYVDNRLQAGIFTPDDLELLNALASQAAIAIENARLYLVAVEKGRLERELQVALQVQSSLIPAEAPRLPGWEFAALWQPARVVGGDYYDFIPVNLVKDLKSSQETALSLSKSLGLVIADVSDKGMAAALFMALTRSTVRASVAPASTPAGGITQANTLISADAANGMFVTLFYAQLDPATGEFTYVNAGHNPPFHYRAKENELTELTRTGMALGIDPTFRYDQRRLTLAPGDIVLLYTDGVTEAPDAQQEEFGVERLMNIVREKRAASAAEIVASIHAALRAFTGDAPLFDDITSVVVKRL